MDQKVSIVVPVYNAEPYLQRCIESMLNQTYQDLEILLIDDGSTDGSLSICRAYAEKDPRIKVFHNENHGVSYTRNFGITQARGSYLTFVDSDDWIDSTYVEKLLSLLRSNSTPISMCGFSLDLEGAEPANWRTFPERVLSFEEALNPFSEYFLGGVSSKMYAMDVLRGAEDNPILFDEDIKIGEDRLFWYRAVLKGQSVAVCSLPLYHYCMNDTGATRSKKFDAIYTDYIARRRISDCVHPYPSLYKKSIVSCVYMAGQGLEAATISSSCEKVQELRQYIREHLSEYLACPGFALRSKIKFLLIFAKSAAITPRKRV